MHKERDASNFDFRVVALLMATITRPDLLHEYVTDGKDKDEHGTPKALHDGTKWLRLRRFGFPAELLAEMLYLFERNGEHEGVQHDIQPDRKPDMPAADMHEEMPAANPASESNEIQNALVTMQRLFQTMAAIEFYCPDQCPDDDWWGDFVPYAAKLTQPLIPAGVQFQR